MKYARNISTNIIRDSSKDLNYLVTANAKDIFGRIFINNSSANKSFNIIGNYGTGKSTFLWALEKELKGEKPYFSDVGKEHPKNFNFIKIIGGDNSLTRALSKALKLPGKVSQKKVLNKLDKIRIKLASENKGLVIVVDEFGKFLEYAAKNNDLDELYLLQEISEWANDDKYDSYFLLTLHQNFTSYAKNLSNQEKLEWEKIKGRFVDLVFNEPVEQLINFATQSLEEFVIPKSINKNFQILSKAILDSKLVSDFSRKDKNFVNRLYPLDWLSMNVLVNSLQRYGQNERSLFSFLNDESDLSVKNFNGIYTVSDVFDYLVDRLSFEIKGSDNPHKAQWHSTFRALERAELVFEDDHDSFLLAQMALKTIGLVNIFSKAGGLFNETFLSKYIQYTKGLQSDKVIEKLKKSGIIRFFKHSNKLNFLEGTDIDLELEVLNVSKEIERNFSISHELFSLIEYPILYIKKSSFKTGTPRFFEFRLWRNEDILEEAKGSIDGYINLVFEDASIEDLLTISQQFNSHLFLHYRNSKEIKNEIFQVKVFSKLLEIHQADINALKLLNDEREYHFQYLKDLVIKQIFNADLNTWIYNGEKLNINSRRELFSSLSEICEIIYSKTPTLKNELINKEYLSAPINTARKYLFSRILEHDHVKDLSFEENKFPPEKAIYISLLKTTGIHKYNTQKGVFEISAPGENSPLHSLWMEGIKFLEAAKTQKKKLSELYAIFSKSPYKLKKGLTQFWIPIFLLGNREDFALFFQENKFVPYFDIDTLDLIHKKPSDFMIKSYNLEGSNLNLLENYKSIVGFNEENYRGIHSTLINIFSNFLQFQRSLTNYTKQTSQLSTFALNLRNAIISAQDPEEALLKDFPKALNLVITDHADVENSLYEFKSRLESSISEIKSTFIDLISRIEKVVTQTLSCKSDDFVNYKKEIELKLQNVDKTLLSNKQMVFYNRIMSPLPDRTSWIKSIADIVLGKKIEDLRDEEEEVLLKHLNDFCLGLLKAADIQIFNKHSRDDKLYYIRFFKENGEFIDQKHLIKKIQNGEYLSVKKSVLEKISDLSVEDRKGLLIDLLSNEIK